MYPTGPPKDTPQNKAPPCIVRVRVRTRVRVRVRVRGRIKMRMSVNADDNDDNDEKENKNEIDDKKRIEREDVKAVRDSLGETICLSVSHKYHPSSLYF